MNKRIADMTSEELADAVSRGVLEVKACKYCGEEFYTLHSSTAKFCGDRCRRMYWHEQKKLHCEVCGAPIPYGKQVYCSDECYKRAIIDLKRRKGGVCIECGAALPPRKSKYCSKKCEREHNRGALKPQKPLSTVSTNENLLSTGHDLASIAKAALEHHMTYGKYIEMLEKAREHGEKAFEHGV